MNAKWIGTKDHSAKWIERGISAGLLLAILVLLYVLHRILLAGQVYSSIQDAAGTVWRGI